jgi:DNA-binding transcriptional LysR family regulator
LLLRELGQYSLQSLRIFSHVASMGSTSEAAQTLGLTQPAVSLQIHSLEGQLGFRLFERKGRNNVLTAQGQIFLQKLLPQLEKLEKVILDVRDSEHRANPELSIGSVEGIGEYWLAQRFPEFSAARQDFRFQVSIADTDLLEQRLLRGELAVVITVRKLENPRVVSQVLMDEKLVPVGTAENIAALEKALTNAKPSARPWEQVHWIGYGEADSPDHWALRWLENVGQLVDRRFKYWHQSNSYPVLKEFLRMGLGVSVAPFHTCELEVEGGELAKLESRRFPALRNRLYVSWREGSLNSAHENFKNWLLKTATKSKT